MHFKTIIISDTHLGSKFSHPDLLLDFLQKNTCDNLILNGDIIDGWALKRGGKWGKTENKIIRKILKISYSGTKVYYIRGNHDDFLDDVVPLKLGEINIIKELIYKSGDKTFFIVHGDVFDMITTNLKWLSVLGSIAYDIILYINRYYNQIRRVFKLKYHPISKDIKYSVKLAINYISSFEDILTNLAKENNYDGVICGHIHTPEIKLINNIVYMNSGDIVENLSLLVEDYDNSWKIIYL